MAAGKVNNVVHQMVVHVCSKAQEVAGTVEMISSCRISRFDIDWGNIPYSARDVAQNVFNRSEECESSFGGAAPSFMCEKFRRSSLGESPDKRTPIGLHRA